MSILSALAASVLVLAHDISGSVVDRNGQAVAGAAVVIVDPAETAKDVRTETDADGKFALSRDDDGGKSLNYQLLVWKDGFAAGTYREEKSTRSFQLELGSNAGDDLRIVLTPQSAVETVIVDPDGNPIVGAKVAPYYVGADRSFVYRQSGLPEFLASVTDADGYATLNGIGEGIGGGFFVDTRNSGEQRFIALNKTTAPPAKIVLSPVGSLRGQMISEDKAALGGWSVNLNSITPGGSSGENGVVRATGYAEVTSLADGSFTVSSLPAGSYRLYATHVATRYSTEATVVEVLPGKEAEVRLNLIAGRRAFGRILERDSNQPIAGARLYFGGAQAVSDDTGFFEGYVKQPPAYVQINSAPDGWIVASHDTRNIEIADPEAREFDLGTITLKAASPITGVVTNEDGQPQPGVTVTAAWVQTSDGKFQTFSWASDRSVTDADGKYRVLNAPGDVTLLLSAIGNNTATKAAVPLATMVDREVNLTVSRDNMAHLTAVVRDNLGNAIPAANARLTYSLETVDHGSMGGRSMILAGHESIVSDANGLLRTPVRIPRHEKYSLVISAEGYLPVTTDFRQLGGTDDDVLLGEYTLQRAKSATGIIVDSMGNPVPGITVASHGIPESRHVGQPLVTVKTDAAGRFRLTPLHPAAAVVTVRAEGWRPTGAAILQADEPLAITVYRAEESIPDAQRVKVPEQRQIPVLAGIFVLKQLMPDLRSSNYFQAEALALLSRVNPDRIPDELADTKDASARVQALVSLKEYEEANAQAEQIEGGYGRAYARFKIIDACPDRDFKQQLIAAALIDAKSVQQPDRRAVVLGGVADRLMAIDQHEEAKALLQDSLEQFQQLPATEWAGFAKGFFAERLARYDFDSAIAMLAGMEPHDRARHCGNIAHALAAVDPERAEKLIVETDVTRSVIAYRIRVCYRMAAVDLERAERVRQGHPERNNNTFAKEHSLGVMAMSVLSKDQKKAQQLLNQAWTELEATAANRNTGSQSGGYRFGVALALLSYAETIDPENLTDHFWRAIALYPGPQGNSWQPESQQLEDIDRQAMLALAFGLYAHEPELCRQIMEPAFEYWSKSDNLQDHGFYRKTATFSAMAMADPRRAAQWAVDAYGMMPVENRRLIPQPWLTVTQTLCSDRQSVQNMLAEEVFTRWLIDKYDL